MTIIAFFAISALISIVFLEDFETEEPTAEPPSLTYSGRSSATSGRSGGDLRLRPPRASAWASTDIMIVVSLE